MLLQIREYIAREGVVSTQQLTRAFQLDLQAIEPMLACWVKKGIIAKCEGQTPCRSACFKCGPKKPDYYKYIKPLSH